MYTLLINLINSRVELFLIVKFTLTTVRPLFINCTISRFYYNIYYNFISINCNNTKQKYDFLCPGQRRQIKYLLRHKKKTINLALYICVSVFDTPSTFSLA